MSLEKLQKEIAVKWKCTCEDCGHINEDYTMDDLLDLIAYVYQAGIDEAVEIVKKQKNTDSCIGISGLHHAEEKRVYNQALDDTIKSLLIKD